MPDVSKLTQPLPGSVTGSDLKLTRVVGNLNNQTARLQRQMGYPFFYPADLRLFDLRELTAVAIHKELKDRVDFLSITRYSLYP
jgi:hypothetical protein